MPATIVILGGYGLAGAPIARMLVQESDANLVIAGRSPEKAEAFAAELGDRARGAYADATKPETLAEVFKGANLVVVCSSTTKYVRETALAALSAGVDWLDIFYGSEKTVALQSLAAEIEGSGRCFLTEAGSHPGLGAALVRFAATRFDGIQTARLGALLNIEGGIPLSEGFYELVETFDKVESAVWADGAWKKCGWRDMRQFGFGALGTRSCFPMMMDELRALPQMLPTLKELGMYMAGFNWVADWFVTPLMLAALRVNRRRFARPMARLLHWSCRHFTRPPYGIMFALEATGMSEGCERRIRVDVTHPDGYVLTAVPAVAGLLQYLDGTARKPGLHMLGQLVEPIRFMRDVERLGVGVSVGVDQGRAF
jgi:hypothetical protein